MPKQISKKRPTVRIVLAFLCACLLALICTMGVSFARYADAKETAAQAQGARFNVTADCTYDSTARTFILQITNHSEVPVFYTLAADGLPPGVTVTNAEGTLNPGESRSHSLSTTEEFLEMHEDILLSAITIEQYIS